MAYIEVDVDIDEFSTSEIVDECIERITTKGRNKITSNQREELLDALGVFHKQGKTSLLDELKMELLASAIDKYTLNELEIMFGVTPKCVVLVDPKQLSIPLD